MKVDFKKTLDAYTAQRNRFRVVDVPPMQYSMVDGHGDPNTSKDYADALAALYPVAYTVKFASKRDLGRDYVVTPLEALWWADDMESFTTNRDKSQWHWTAMIMVPDWIEKAMFDDAVTSVTKKRNPIGISRIRLETMHEGRCVQTLHVGSYDDEALVLDELHSRYLPDAGLEMTGKHHEIYLSDPRRVEPSRLRTILRQPVR
ncbi:GyrI-like domain-containing protein [Rhodococcoides kyotonense]|uniref:GyrI-like small molecule binding domain-containing protein n=1 Tax=Rhodococcoides kyotonense TaxID=398843 RepID=A0A239JYF4_9NOCA|nr:GyrI-like domain-containing protein [Rhodococcus kyotonensis]SNT09884.1 hypothetical protein SAMN05421642_109103 [Rhodococcus kyotonensis]